MAVLRETNQSKKKMNMFREFSILCLVLFLIQSAKVFADRPQLSRSDIEELSLEVKNNNKRILGHVNNNDFHGELEQRTQLHSILRKALGENNWDTRGAEKYLETSRRLNALNNAQQDQIRKARYLCKESASLHRKGKSKTAITYYLKAADIFTKLLGEENTERIQLHRDLATTQTHCGLFSEAEVTQKKALQMVERMYGRHGKNTPTYANTLNSFACCHIENGNFIKAENLLLLARSIQTNAVGDGSDLSVPIQANLVRVYLKSESFEKAEYAAKRLIEITEKMLPRQTGFYWKGRMDLALSYSGQNRHAEAVETYKKVVAIIDSSKIRISQSFMVICYEGYAQVLFNAGSTELASVYKKKTELLQSNIRKSAEAKRKLRF